MDRLIGTTMGPYTITERIGEGGMAIVYKGYQESLHRYVALKVLRDELARDQQFVARFRQEALAAANLNHPNILHVYDAGAANGKYFIAMAYVDGGTLKELIHQGVIEPARAVSITIQLAEALDHAHNQGLIHRDVKPSNVLMTRDGRPLLTDFGIAKALFEAKQLTRTGASIGTPEYMAPEQAQGRSPDGRTDIYALGVVLYEMLAAKVPFCTDTPVATMYMHVHEPPPPLPRAEATIPEWLENVVCKALAKDPADRYATSALFAAALRQGRESWAAVAGPLAGAAAVAGTVAAGAAAATTTPADTEAVTMVEPGAAGTVGPAAAGTATRTPVETEAVTMAAAGAAAAGMAAGTAGHAGAATAAATPAPAAATGTPVAEKRRKALVPILIAAIALLVVATAASAAVLLMGGESTPTPFITEVIIGEDKPTEDVGDAGGGPSPTPTVPEEGTTTTPTPTPTLTSTSTPTVTPSGTATSTPSPSPTASHTPTRTPTATTAATSTPIPAPTDTPVPPTNTPVPPTNTPVPPTKPPPTPTPVPPTPTPVPPTPTPRPPTPTPPPPPPPP